MPVGYQWYAPGQGAGGSNYQTNVGPNPDIREAAQAGWQFGGQQGLANQKDIAGIQAGAGIQEAQIGANASMYPATLQQQRFNRVFPFVQSQLGRVGDLAFSGAADGGAAGGIGPNIKVGGVWNPQQIAQQVNATRAQNDQAMQSHMATNAQNLSGRGFGSNSPLLQALQGQAYGQNLATNTQAEQTLRTQAAQQNAEHLLNTQTARANEYAQRQQERLTGRGQTLNTYSALLNALSGLA